MRVLTGNNTEQPKLVIAGNNFLPERALPLWQWAAAQQHAPSQALVHTRCAYDGDDDGKSVSGSEASRTHREEWLPQATGPRCPPPGGGCERLASHDTHYELLECSGQLVRICCCLPAGRGGCHALVQSWGSASVQSVTSAEECSAGRHVPLHGVDRGLRHNRC